MRFSSQRLSGSPVDASLLRRPCQRRSARGARVSGKSCRCRCREGKGVFVTTSIFSAPAIDFVRHLPQLIVLIDGDRLADLMIEHGVGVRIARTVKVKRLDEDFFVEE